jgi:hypothetical protein
MMGDEAARIAIGEGQLAGHARKLRPLRGMRRAGKTTAEILEWPASSGSLSGFQVLFGYIARRLF